MNKPASYNHFFICVLMAALFLSFSNPLPITSSTGMLHIKFVHTANNKILTLRDSSYINSFGETYSVNKLKYYIGHLSLQNKKPLDQPNIYYLINAALEENTITLNIPAGSYTEFNFQIGVDSIDNCSGAQDGSLDPIQDMFWTWNSGYVFFKLDGRSDASTADRERIEHHIGGYKGSNNAVRQISLRMSDSQPLIITENKVTELLIETNLDPYWNAANPIQIANTAVITLPGTLAMKAADNLPALFSVRTVEMKP